ncbi:hypothetical protein EBR66_04130 [bacterium]|nr:hypothetical protein [bacterium]
MSFIRYLTRRAAESVSYGVGFGLLAFSLGWAMKSEVEVMHTLVALVASMGALSALAMRLSPMGWEDQSSCNHMGVGQYEHDLDEAARLDRQWFKWW